MRTQMVFGALALVATLAVPAMAADGGPVPDTEREFGAKMLVCNACHGDKGTPKTAVIPIIWGQQENYLSKQLHDFDTGDRNNEIMAWMAKTLSRSEQATVAGTLAKRGWPAKVVSVAATQPPRGVAVCQACHQANFMGAVQAEGMTTPRLAGQNYEYLVEAMRKFADGERTNNADMVQIMKGMPAADRDAMAHYLSGL